MKDNEKHLILEVKDVVKKYQTGMVCLQRSTMSVLTFERGSFWV